METRRLGKTDMYVTALGFGGAEIGFQSVAQTIVTELLNAALDVGLNVIDTGECYGGSEELIGNAVGYRRGDYFLFTKVGHASGLDLPDWDPAMMELSIDRSLKRLKTDHLDLIQLHTCSEDKLRQGDVIEVVQKARDAGKARYIGYSGDSKAAHYAVTCGAFDTLQTSISIADQEGIELTLPEAAAKQVGVIAKRPIANAAWQYGDKPENGYYVPYWERFQKLKYPFLEGEVADAAAIALRFTLSMPAVATAIVGTTNPKRWAQNADSANRGALDEAAIAEIRAKWKTAAEAGWIGQA